MHASLNVGHVVCFGSQQHSSPGLMFPRSRGSLYQTEALSVNNTSRCASLEAEIFSVTAKEWMVWRRRSKGNLSLKKKDEWQEVWEKN